MLALGGPGGRCALFGAESADLCVDELWVSGQCLTVVESEFFEATGFGVFDEDVGLLDDAVGVLKVVGVVEVEED